MHLLLHGLGTDAHATARLREHGVAVLKLALERKPPSVDCVGALLGCCALRAKAPTFVSHADFDPILAELIKQIERSAREMASAQRLLKPPGQLCALLRMAELAHNYVQLHATKPVEVAQASPSRDACVLCLPWANAAGAVSAPPPRWAQPLRAP